uniref:Uncharacterized protein n=1 Tax=Plectus sambesii TaxID=2011161 RepID=A0A914VYV7_9BILA
MALRKLFGLLLLASCLLQTVALTELQSLCVGANQTYLGSSCYVLHGTPRVTYSRAKVACEDYLGYKGHLYHIRNAVIKNTTHQFILSNGLTASDMNVWTSFEQYDANGARNAGWGFAERDGTVTPASYVPWGWNGGGWEPVGPTSHTRAPYAPYYFGLNDAPGEGMGNMPFICEYEEANKHIVTNLEKSCAALNRYHTYANKKCYVMHAELLAYSAAKVACTDVLNYNGHLVHPRSNEQLNILNNFMLAAGPVSEIYIGVEQTNLTAADSKTIGWYYTTPSKSNEQATFLPWTPTEPDGGTGSNNVIYISGSRSFSDVPATKARAFVCVYDDIMYSLKVSNSVSQSSSFSQIAQTSNASLAKCTRDCRINQACSSFAYSLSTSTCQLLASSSSSGNFSLAASFIMYTRQSP